MMHDDATDIESTNGAGHGVSVVSQSASSQTTERASLLKAKPPRHNANAAQASVGVKSSPALGVDAKREENSEEPDYVLYAAFGLFVLASLGNRLFQKLMTIPMYNYPITVNLLSVSAYIPMSFAYIIPALYCTKDGPITPEQTAIPKSRFAVMGGLDCVSSLMQILAVNFIPNASTLVLLQQSAIPISMVISRLSFKHVRYDWYQIIGAAVVLCGISVVIVPQAAAGSSQKDSDAPGPQWLWPLTIILSCIPMCLGSVYKEKALGEHDVDVVYLNGWVAVFQTIMSLPLAIPTAFATNLPLAEVPRNIKDGVLCYLGHSSYHDEPLPAALFALRNGTRHMGETTYQPPNDSCETAPYFVTAFIAFNLAYNVLIIVILKRGSSSLLYLGSTVLVPVSNGMFSLKFIPGHKPLHLADVIGLVVIMTGLILYRCGSAIAAFLRAPGRLDALSKLLLLDALDEDEDIDEAATLGDASSASRRARTFLKTLPAERRSLLATARSRTNQEDDIPTALMRESLKATRHNLFPRDRIARFFGINHLEMLQPLAQAQTLHLRRRIARSNAQIRKEFLLKLGFSPDPLTVNRSPGYIPHASASPGDFRRQQARAAADFDRQRHPRPPEEASASIPQHIRVANLRRASSFDTRRR